jgi:hypothetical protein
VEEPWMRASVQRRLLGGQLLLPLLLPLLLCLDGRMLLQRRRRKDSPMQHMACCSRSSDRSRGKLQASGCLQQQLRKAALLCLPLSQLCPLLLLLLLLLCPLLRAPGS